MTTRLPFEPPVPERETPTEKAATIAAGVGVVALAVIAEPILHVLRIPALFLPEVEPPAFDVEAALRACNADETRAPEIDERGFVECVHCSAFVPYASMSLNEDGCFCVVGRRGRPSWLPLTVLALLLRRRRRPG